MTNADKIRNLSDEELVDLLAWGEVYAEGLKVPSCDEGCEDCKSGCAAECPIEKREKNVREWLQTQEEQKWQKDVQEGTQLPEKCTKQ